MVFRIPRCLRLVLLAAVAGLAAIDASAAGDTAKVDWEAERAAIDASFAEDLAKLAATCDQLGLKPQAAITRAWPNARSPGRQVLFFEPNEITSPAAAAPLVERQWHAAFVKARQAKADALIAVAQRAHDAGEWELGYRLAYEALRENPDHVIARRVAGYTKAAGGWSPAGAPSVSLSQAPHPKYGWKARGHWRVESEHFSIGTNHSAAAGLALAERLEELHTAWRQLFARYWTNGATLERAWSGAAPTPRGLRTKHKVVLFRNREEYVAALRPIQPLAGMTEGIYLDGEKTSYFFAGDERVEATWRHEATHQLFHEMAPVAAKVGESRNFWIIEGIALYMESLARRDGYCYVGGWDSGRLQFARYWALLGDFYVRLHQFTALDRQTLQTDKNVRQLYSQAAGVTHYLMDGSEGRHRAALVDYLKAVYSGRDQGDSLANLTGEEFAKLDSAYVDFLRVTDDDLVRTPALPERRQLCLGGTTVTDVGLAKLPAMKQLDWLNLDRLKVTDASVARYRESTALTQLHLEKTAITDAALETIATFAALEELDLSHTAVTDAGLAQLRGLTKLKLLRLSGTNVTADGLARLRKDLPNLGGE